MPDQDKSTLDQLIDLFVYAPVGMIYEYPDVLPKLVKRGKSQVQLAKVLSQMAAKQGQKGADSVVGDVWSTVAQGITEVGTMVGLAPEPPRAEPRHDDPSAPAAEAAAGGSATRTPTSKPPVAEKSVTEKAGSKKPAAEKAGSKKPAAEKAGSKKPAAKKAGSKKPAAKKAGSKKPVAKKKAVAAKQLRSSTDAVATDDVPAPPIARYDELTARQLIELVASLDADQRQRVRLYEQTNRNRKTLLAKLDSLDRA